MTTQGTSESTCHDVVGRLRDRCARAVQILIAFFPQGLARLRDVAPYAAIELILPGGSLVALALWYRQHAKSRKRLSRHVPINTAIRGLESSV